MKHIRVICFLFLVSCSTAYKSPQGSYVVKTYDDQLNVTGTYYINEYKQDGFELLQFNWNGEVVKIRGNYSIQRYP